MSQRTDLLVEGQVTLNTTGPFSGAWISDWFDSGDVTRIAVLWSSNVSSSGFCEVIFGDDNPTGGPPALWHGRAATSISAGVVTELTVPTRYFRVYIGGSDTYYATVRVV